jgi:hypothetical protein
LQVLGALSSASAVRRCADERVYVPNVPDVAWPTDALHASAEATVEAMGVLVPFTRCNSAASGCPPGQLTEFC